MLIFKGITTFCRSNRMKRKHILNAKGRKCNTLLISLPLPNWNIVKYTNEIIVVTDMINVIKREGVFIFL